jgi:hypothetical protein
MLDKKTLEILSQAVLLLAAVISYYALKSKIKKQVK